MKVMKDDGAIRAMATRMVLEKTDRLLGWDGRVRILRPKESADNSGSMAPAWTDGKLITINGRQNPLWNAFRKGFTHETMMLVTALNYHELSHCLFTPRLDAPLVNRVRNEGMFISLNALEDQSAESKFVRLYKPAAAYFTTIIAQLMMGRQDLVTQNYPLIAGRRFLPADIRRVFRDNFVRPDLIGDFERVIDEYCNTVYPRDEDRMYELVKEYHELIREALGKDAIPCTFHAEHIGSTDEEGGLINGKPMDPGEVGRIVAISPVGEDISGEPVGAGQKKLNPGDVITSNSPPTKPPKSDKDQGEDDSGQGERPEKASQGSEDSDAGEDTSENASDDGDEPGDQDGMPGGRGAGTFKGESKKHAPSDLDELLRDAIEDAREEVAHDLDARQEAIQHSEDAYQVDSDAGRFSTRGIAAVHTTTAQQVERALRRLNQKFKPGWHRRQESGKVNVNDLARIKRGHTDVFKRFSPGVNNALKFEVCLLLDQSGSMHSYTKEACEALWILHRAMKTVGAEITVLGYSDSHACKVLMQRGDPTPKMINDYHTGGSTYVMPALQEVSRIFKVSRKPLKLCVIVTDGCFSDSTNVGAWIQASSDPVAIVGIGHDVRQYGWVPEKYRSLKSSKTINTPLDLVPLVQDLVTQLSMERYDKK